jgi:hypothetical protein
MTSKTPFAIALSGLSIYDTLEQRSDLLLDRQSLETVLNQGLRGLDLNYKIRTRSKVVKAKICELLGYPVPPAFRRTRPRFPGQDFDVYVQKSDNLQVWNQDIVPARRYVIVRVDGTGKATKVRVAAGEVLAKYDTTGTLTGKYQAKSRTPVDASLLVSADDTANVRKRIVKTAPAVWHDFLPIRTLFAELLPLIGSTIPDAGIDQERNRGWALHETVCQRIARIVASDCGQFPDVPEQLLELKLQTASTIDLGLVSPDSTAQIAGLPAFRHCDVRYAVFYGSLAPTGVRLDHLVISTGAEFFRFFQRFEGQVINKKLQFRLPASFFR